MLFFEELLGRVLVHFGRVAILRKLLLRNIICSKLHSSHIHHTLSPALNQYFSGDKTSLISIWVSFLDHKFISTYIHCHIGLFFTLETLKIKVEYCYIHCIVGPVLPRNIMVYKNLISRWVWQSANLLREVRPAGRRRWGVLWPAPLCNCSGGGRRWGAQPSIAIFFSSFSLLLFFYILPFISVSGKPSIF